MATKSLVPIIGVKDKGSFNQGSQYIQDKIVENLENRKRIIDNWRAENSDKAMRPEVNEKFRSASETYRDIIELVKNME